MKIAFYFAGFVCGVFITFLAATGRIHASKFDYAFLCRLVTVSIFGSLCNAIASKYEQESD